MDSKLDSEKKFAYCVGNDNKTHYNLQDITIKNVFCNSSSETEEVCIVLKEILR